jgi:hypothetical protein
VKAIAGKVCTGYKRQRHREVALVISANPRRVHGQLDRGQADATYEVIRGEDTCPGPFLQQSVISRLATVIGIRWISLDVLSVRVNARASSIWLRLQDAHKDVCQPGRIAWGSGRKRRKPCDALVRTARLREVIERDLVPFTGAGSCCAPTPTRRSFNEKGYPDCLQSKRSTAREWLKHQQGSRFKTLNPSPC